jgi:hypothetical protein
MDPACLFDLGNSGTCDVTQNKDRMIGHAFHSARKKSRGEPLLTTDHVLVETWTLLRYRIDRHAAERFWEGL